MTAKEKAKELIEKFGSIYSWDGVDLTKECALICVDEMIRNEVNTTMHYNDSIMDYWKEVKEEINKIDIW